MQALLIVAHGSRREESNEEIRRLTEKVSAKAAGQFDLIECAFLELASTLIPDGVQGLVDQGATSIMVLPYFLAKGAHVANDIPDAVAVARNAHPDVDITISNYFGACDTVPDALVKLAMTAQDKQL